MKKVDLFCSEKILFKMDKEIPKNLTFPKLRFKNVKEVKKLDEYGPPPDNDCFFLRYPHQLGAKYWGFFSFRSLKTREKYISFAQLVLLSLYIFLGKCVYFSIFE